MLSVRVYSLNQGQLRWRSDTTDRLWSPFPPNSKFLSLINLLHVYVGEEQHKCAITGNLYEDYEHLHRVTWTVFQEFNESFCLRRSWNLKWLWSYGKLYGKLLWQSLGTEIASCLDSSRGATWKTRISSKNVLFWLFNIKDESNEIHSAITTNWHYISSSSSLYVLLLKIFRLFYVIFYFFNVYNLSFFFFCCKTWSAKYKVK